MKTFLLFVAAVICAPFIALVALALILWGHHCWHELGRTYAADVPGYCQAIGLMASGLFIGLGVIAAFVLALAFTPLRNWWKGFIDTFRQAPAPAPDPLQVFRSLSAELPAANAPQVLALAQSWVQQELASKGGAP